MELGGDLFRRERNLSHLTELGQRMLPLIRQCYESAQSAKSMAQSIKAGAVAPLPIALSISINLILLLPFLTELVRALPGLELRFLRGDSLQVAEYLKKGDAEIAIAGPLPESWERLEAWPLFVEPYVLMAGGDNPISQSAEIAVSTLSKQRLLCRNYCEHIGQLSEFLDGQGVAGLLRHQVVAEHDLISLLQADFGVAIAPASSVTSPLVQRRRIQGLDLNRTVSVFSVAGRQRSTAGSTLVKMLRAADWSCFEEEAVLGPKRGSVSADRAS
jgi:DNA-binding transcriptional LysR family regulator